MSVSDTSRELTFVRALNEALHQEMERDEEVFIIGEDIGRRGGDFGATVGLWKRWPDRCRDTPLSEAAITGLGVGAAMAGMRPIVEIMFVDFLAECYDQVVNNMAKVHYMFGGQIKAPMVIRTLCGGGFHAGPHHSQSAEGWLMNVPGITVVAPSDAYDAKGLLIASIRNDNPIVFMEHKGLYGTKGPVPREPYEVPLYKAQIKRPGQDVTVVAGLKMVNLALEAAAELAKEEVDVEVIDLTTIKPWDQETVLASVHKTGRLVTVFENPKMGGPGSEISATVGEKAFHALKAPVKRVAGLDTPHAFAPVLEDYILPHKKDVIEAIWDVVDY
jgi:acetoin:2,6-dichlorophenolindophenol oxidoreductase subunit beta